MEKVKKRRKARRERVCECSTSACASLAGASLVCWSEEGTVWTVGQEGKVLGHMLRCS
uniref:Uncharacterized protein n=1 Tax=Anopheles albimanus TaxID=7167 RepID=A0A182FZ33_ANOAL